MAIAEAVEVFRGKGCEGPSQGRPLGNSVSAGTTDSPHAASLFSAISRRLSYADLPSDPFRAVILHLLLLLMSWVSHCVAAGS